MLPAAGIALLIKGRALAQLLDDAFGAGADIVPVLLSAALCLLASMNDMAAPSVSLEGRQLWLAQSLRSRRGRCCAQSSTRSCC